uniref:LicD/FKTN/FKRP nucleotidyltransferase domain-containing protein n=1 Tax=Globisporangium ultimum (strain ATCC 200006 / CBS 805.95 / DAOM BR144) TaxID=431595 RepID=K3WTB9_GLOUD
MVEVLPQFFQPHDRKPTRLSRWVVWLSNMSIRNVAQLVVAGAVLYVVVKLFVKDLVDQVITEMFYTRFVNGKRCEKMQLAHIEHDFHDPNDCFSRADIQQIILGLVFAIADVFERHDIPYWLDSGTLLGSYREKTVIPHDFDADIGIDEATYRRLRDGDEPLEFPSVYELQIQDAKFRKRGYRDDGIPGRLVHTKSGLYVDIFVFLESKTLEVDTEPMFAPLPSGCFGGCARCPAVSESAKEFKIPKSWVFPLKPCWFGARMVSCPAQPEKYLDYMYGPDYMTPK